MRKALFILYVVFTCVHVTCLSLASVTHPFQVLYARSAKTTSGTELKSLDYLSIDDIVKVEKGGFLSIVHYTSIPLEFTTDTLINLRELHERIVPVSNDKSKGRRRNPDQSMGTRPMLGHLFIENPAIANKNKLSRTGACHDCSQLMILYPPAGVGYLTYFSDSLCIKWTKGTSAKYKVLITTLFDDHIDSVTVNTNEFMLDGERLRKATMGEDVLVINITGIGNHWDHVIAVVRKFPDRFGFEIPYKCRPSNATAAVLAGLHIDSQTSQYILQAEEYFVLATQLSNDDFYRVVLDNFRKRNKSPD
jgi:hypothetical protein